MHVSTSTKQIVTDKIFILHKAQSPLSSIIVNCVWNQPSQYIIRYHRHYMVI